MDSFVMVGTVSAFLKMIRLSDMDLFLKFGPIKEELPAPVEKTILTALYAELSDRNFSRDVLQTRPRDLSVVRVTNSKWSDLGSPHRVLTALSEIGKLSSRKKMATAAHLMQLLEGHYERGRGREAV